MVEKLRNNRSVLFFFALLAATYLPMFAKEEILNAFAREDKIYESLSPLYLFIVSILFFTAFYRSPIKLSLKDPAWLKRISFLGFALLFLLATFEEISWGQRIFGIETPNLIKDVNVQKELTIHNLEFFQGDDAALPLDFDQLSALFALTIGFIIPLACMLIKPLRDFLSTKFPILPLQYGFLYPANYIIQKAIVRLLPRFPDLYHHTQMKIPQGVHEIREHGYALLLLISVAFYLILKLDLLNQEQS